MERDFIENTKSYNLTNDYFFKRIFGKVGNENITKALISSVLGYKVNDLSLHENTILEKDLINDKVGILDIRATLNQTIPCDVEMQIASSKHIAERILWYWAKLYCSQISRGEQYGKLHKTIAILFAVEPISNLKDIIEFKTKWQIREENHHTLLLTEALEIYIISLDKLQEQERNNTLENTTLSQWAKFILAPEKLEKDMENNENIKEAKNIYDEINEDAHEKYLAELRQKYIMDMHDFEETGFDKGMEKGIEKGIKQGIEQGKKETTISIIKNLLSLEISVDKIAKATNLSIEEINIIIKENNL